jgi:hypothetical protein
MSIGEEVPNIEFQSNKWNKYAPYNMQIKDCTPARLLFFWTYFLRLTLLFAWNLQVCGWLANRL